MELNWRRHPEIGETLVANWRHRTFEVQNVMGMWRAAESTPHPVVLDELEESSRLVACFCEFLIDAIEYVESQIPFLQNSKPQIEIIEFLESRNRES